MATFTNQATLSYQNTTVLSNVVTGELLPPLSVTKEALLPTYGAGDTLTFIVSLRRCGCGCCTDITLTDDLGAYAFGDGTLVPLDYVPGSLKYYVNGTLQQTPEITEFPFAVSGIAMPADGNAVLVYAVTVNAYAPLGEGGSITNTVSAACEGEEASTASTTVLAEQTGELAITKAVVPSSLCGGDTLTYTLTLENYGISPIPAEGGAVVSDTFSPILTSLTATLDGVPLVEGLDYTYNEATGFFTTLPGVIALPGATVTQDPVTGVFRLEPGSATLVISGRVEGE